MPPKYIVIVGNDGLIRELNNYEFITTIPFLIGTYCEIISTKNETYEEIADHFQLVKVLKGIDCFSYLFYPNNENTIKSDRLTKYEIVNFTKPVLFIERNFENSTDDLLSICYELERVFKD